MEIEFQNSKNDYVNFYKLYLKSNIQRQIVFTVILLFFVVSIISNKQFTWPDRFFAIAGYAVIVVCLAYFIPLLIVTIKLNKQLSKDDSFLEKRKIIITDEGLRTQIGDNNILRSWNSVRYIHLNEKFIYLKFVDKKLGIIPKSAFPSEKEAINFLRIIDSRLTKGSGYKPIQDYTVKNPPYKLGYWGLFPMVGAFVGVTLIINGVIKYKDKWLVLIGVGCIAFTIAVYTSLFFYGESKSERANFIPLVKPELNSLVKEIEFYKIQNGNYPDSLKQLSQDSFTNIFDPLQEGKKNMNYIYHKIGNKYTLFSSGIDQIPNTADDIYPSIDTAKTGLLIKH